ncbi:MAG TPA: response regulator transcription factor [Solirubrobacteraceae bacterium]|jgi:DNA-binding NarL/FixJ family response regulator|nr:response regulator transcription factor [Solirubrobacteraceae bacterium]
MRENFYMLVADRDETGCVAVATLVSQIGLAVASVATGAEALDLARREPPAVVAIDVELADPSGYEVCREMRDRYGETLPIVFMSSTRTARFDEIAGLLLGADDYFIKPLQSDRFLARIRRLVARSSTPATNSALTKREQDVLGLLVDGRRLPEIAEALCITRKTAATHIEHILSKLGAHSQAQAVAFAMRDKVLPVRV